MRAAFVVHLFYDDIAAELIDALARLRRAIDVVVTTPRPLTPAMRRALGRLGGRIDVVETENVGRDIGPFLEVLPLLARRGYDLFCKLHTKQGFSGYGADWRAALYEALIGSGRQIDRIVAAFARDEKLAIVGADHLFLSVARHLPSNRQTVLRVARLAFPGQDIPGDWGFFAGTMFWGRTRSFNRFARLRNYGVLLEPDNTAIDGQVVHALERVFGLVGVVGGGRYGRAVESPARIPITFGDFSTSIPTETLFQRLIAIRQKRGLKPYPQKLLRNFIAAHNPLVHYAESRAGSRFDPNPLLHETWYSARHKEALSDSTGAMLHYMREGALAGANPSPIFDSGSYYRKNPDLLRAGVNPLVHFLRSGEADSGHGVFLPSTGSADMRWSRPEPIANTYDADLERAFWDCIGAFPKDVAASARATPVSVVMPVFGDAAETIDTIKSVLWQTHRNLELIVVGATQAMRGNRAFRPDERIRLVGAEETRPAALRNRGLAAASGKLVAFIDPGNCWRPRFLEAMTMLMESSGVAGAMAIAEFRFGDNVLGYVGSQFDRRLCLEFNTVTLDVFCCERARLAELGGFNENSPLAVWDLILRYASANQFAFAPVLGGSIRGINALEGWAPGRRYNADAHLVRDRNLGRSTVSREPTLSIAVKVAAPEGAHLRWGDYHFAVALKDALGRIGHDVRIDFRDEWYAPRTARDDVAIVLRGPKRYEPDPAQVNLLWNISKPDDVTYEEYESYDLVYVASRSYADFLRWVLKRDVQVLLQATDPARFRPVPVRERKASRVLFVGNNWDRDRPIVRWAIEAGVKLQIFGAGWKEVAPAELVKGDYIDNGSLAAFYAGADAVLNDHLGSMRDFGFISNRVFDVLASVGRLVSDPIPSMTRLFGPSVVGVRDPGELVAAVRTLGRNEGVKRSRLSVAKTVAVRHNFDERARVIAEDLSRRLNYERPTANKRARNSYRGRSRRKALLLCADRAKAPDDTAFVRLISPLTSEYAEEVELIVGGEDQIDPQAHFDFCIAQIGARGDHRRTALLAKRLRSSGVPLILDVPAGLRADEPTADRGRSARLLGQARQCWFESDGAHKKQPRLRGRAHIVPSGIDPRIWKDYSSSPRSVLGHGPLRIVWVRRAYDASSERFVFPALDRLWTAMPGSFEATVVGAGRSLPQRPWLRLLQPPSGAAASYPRAARWLRQQGPFDIGLAPIANADASVEASDIAFLEYTALGLLSVLSKGPAHRAGDGAPLAVIVGNAGDWFSALARLVLARGDFVPVAEAAQSYVWRERTVDVVAAQQIALIAEVLGRQPQRYLTRG